MALEKTVKDRFEHAKRIVCTVGGACGMAGAFLPHKVSKDMARKRFVFCRRLCFLIRQSEVSP